MLQHVEKSGGHGAPLPQPSFPEITTMAGADGAIGHLPASRESIVTRLLVRRWLIVLTAVILVSLSLIYSLPWYASAFSFLLFTCGAALIPRVGLLRLERPVILTSYTGLEPGAVVDGMVKALPETAIVLASDGTILSFNESATELFGGLKDGFHISSATRNPQILNAVAVCGASTSRQTVSFTDRVPVERHMSATVSFLNVGTTPRDPAILLCLRDLTEQRRLDQLRSDFIANASHEIKTPLASILGFIETLQGPARNDTEARERFLGIMAKQAERMARLIDNLMSLSRVEMRAHLKPQDPVKISELVAQARDALEPMAAEADIRVELISQLNGAMVLGDKDELTQVLINLIHNSIKYGRRGGRVGITVERMANGASPKIAVSVEDNGQGIAPLHLPRLTERFYRIPDMASLEKGGTGLGLAIVKHVLNRHRGELRISSEVGAGSKFTVLLSEYIVPPSSRQR